jgi:hypothetical protein
MGKRQFIFLFFLFLVRSGRAGHDVHRTMEDVRVILYRIVRRSHIIFIPALSSVLTLTRLPDLTAMQEGQRESRSEGAQQKGGGESKGTVSVSRV